MRAAEKTAERLQARREQEVKDEQNAIQKAEFQTRYGPAVKQRLVRYPNFLALLQGEFPKARLPSAPAANEVHKVYVRCLAKFHPDKYRQENMRQQVEAEEMYKGLGNAYEAYKNGKYHLKRW